MRYYVRRKKLSRKRRQSLQNILFGIPFLPPVSADFTILKLSIRKQKYDNVIFFAEVTVSIVADLSIQTQ